MMPCKRRQLAGSCSTLNSSPSRSRASVNSSWVLRRVYKFGLQEILGAINALVAAENVVVNRPAVEAGWATLKEGGDFADGLIAYEGSWLGGETFVFVR